MDSRIINWEVETKIKNYEKDNESGMKTGTIDAVGAEHIFIVGDTISGKVAKFYVDEILETRPAKGEYKSTPPTFQRLKVHRA